MVRLRLLLPQSVNNPMTKAHKAKSALKIEKGVRNID